MEQETTKQEQQYYYYYDLKIEKWSDLSELNGQSIPSEKLRAIFNNYELTYQSDTILSDDDVVEIDIKNYSQKLKVAGDQLVLNVSKTTAPMSWSQPRTRRLDFGTNYIIDQIRVRYALFNRPISGLSNIVMDNYAPKIICNTNFNEQSLASLKLPKTIYTISPWFASLLGANKIETEQLCRILGYSAKDLKALVTKVKQKDLAITFVGYGGTNINTIHWLTEILKLTKAVNLFSYVEIFEPEDAEISNLLRFPKDPNLNYSGAPYFGPSKLRLLDKLELNLLSRKLPLIRRGRLEIVRYTESRSFTYDASARKRFTKLNHVVYGAPGINTRIELSEAGRFISATHSGNSCSMWLNPTQDADLQVESYGLIQLTPFFMNQLRMAIGLLEILASDQDLTEKDKELLNYSFDGIAKLPTDRVYNFQLGSHNGHMSTEAEAAQQF